MKSRPRTEGMIEAYAEGAQHTHLALRRDRCRESVILMTLRGESVYHGEGLNLTYRTIRIDHVDDSLQSTGRITR